MELEDIQAHRLVQTNVVKLVGVEKSLERSAHLVPVDIVPEDLLLHQPLALVPRTSVDTAAVRLLRRL